MRTPMRWTAVSLAGVLFPAGCSGGRAVSTSAAAAGKEQHAGQTHGGPPHRGTHGARLGRRPGADGVRFLIVTDSVPNLTRTRSVPDPGRVRPATGLLVPDAGTVHVHGVDVWAQPAQAAPLLGVLPDGLRLFDRLTGPELISYAGLLRGMDAGVVAGRRDDLLGALDLHQAGSTLVADYSAGMTKKVALACALVHAPRVLVLDEPFEAVDPVSATAIRTILQQFVEAGGTVVMSSHVMALVERVCNHVADVV